MEGERAASPSSSLPSASSSSFLSLPASSVLTKRGKKDQEKEKSRTEWKKKKKKEEKKSEEEKEDESACSSSSAFFFSSSFSTSVSSPKCFLLHPRNSQPSVQVKESSSSSFFSLSFLFSFSFFLFLSVLFASLFSSSFSLSSSVELLSPLPFHNGISSSLLLLLLQDVPVSLSSSSLSPSSFSPRRLSGIVNTDGSSIGDSSSSSSGEREIPFLSPSVAGQGFLPSSSTASSSSSAFTESVKEEEEKKKKKNGANSEEQEKKKKEKSDTLDVLGLPKREKVYRARLYGSMFSYAYYFLDILVGTPPQRSSVILDTGSSLLAFPCVGCEACGEHLDPAVDTRRSSTGEWVDCRDKERCFGTCATGGGGSLLSDPGSPHRCMYTQTYSEGSSIHGIYFSDHVALGEVEQNNPPVRYDFVGCHTQETNLFVTQKAAGIFGISFPKGHRQPTLLDVMFSHGDNLVKQKMFSVCISEDGGLLTVGGYEPSLLVSPRQREGSTPSHASFFLSSQDTSSSKSYLNEGGGGPEEEEKKFLVTTHERRVTEGQEEKAREGEEEIMKRMRDLEDLEGVSPHYSSLITWTRIISHSTYRVPLARMEVEGLILGYNEEEFGNTMVDSGTTYSYFPPSVFGRWRSFLSRFCRPELFCERERDGRLCWRMPPGTDLSSLFPPIKVTFGDDAHSQLLWMPQGYLYRRTGGYFCDGLDDNKMSASVLGLSFFKNKQVLFDREHDRVGFAAAKCPTYFLDQRPPGPPGVHTPGTGVDSRPPVGVPKGVPSPSGVLDGELKGEEENEEEEEESPSKTEEEEEPHSLFSAKNLWVAVSLILIGILLAMLIILLQTIKPFSSLFLSRGRGSPSSAIAPFPTTSPPTSSSSSAHPLPLVVSSTSMLKGIEKFTKTKKERNLQKSFQKYRGVDTARPFTAARDISSPPYYNDQGEAEEKREEEEDVFYGEEGNDTFFVEEDEEDQPIDRRETSRRERQQRRERGGGGVDGSDYDSSQGEKESEAFPPSPPPRGPTRSSSIVGSLDGRQHRDAPGSARPRSLPEETLTERNKCLRTRNESLLLDLPLSDNETDETIV
ncbi:aspartyl protease asp5 [Cystoisospora suis]|uniref:Aspartyl protease asp5 n=1 Tax=Cystoisospora suis TaxID=483139 RepID=A0A2C6KRV5_9APIC|nr:aspartyl protease asp5 [Cystoisospora suis]